MKTSIWLGAALSLIAKIAFATTIFLTSGTTWTVPQDFSPSNTIEIIGAGAAGDVRCGLFPQSTGGGGGSYVKASGIALIPGATYNVHFGGESGTSGGSGAADGVWFGTSGTLYAESGWNGGDCSHGGSGGRTTGSTGTTKFAGGNGSTGLGAGMGLGAGGGAAGKNGVGGSAAGEDGGTGDNGSGGAGGIGLTDGAPGMEWDSTHGSGGGGGCDPMVGCGNGGLYGGAAGYGALGKGGLIVIIYTPRKRVSSGVF